MDNLIWQSFLYLSEELSESECNAFELQLESDPQAQQALVRAGQLYGTVFEVCEVSESQSASVAPVSEVSQVSTTQVSTTSRWSMLTVVAACLLAMAYFVFPGSGNSPNVAQRSGSSSLDAGELVFLWSESGTQSDDTPALATDEELADEELAVSETSSKDLLVPGWMLAAVSPGQVDIDSLPIEPSPLSIPQ